MRAHVECNKNGFYTVYPEGELPFGLFGEGSSANEAIRNFLDVFETMRQKHLQREGVDVQVNFEFIYDASAFLQHYKGMLTLSGLSRITGINKAQLSQYVCGTRRPSLRTQIRIKTSVKSFANELIRSLD